MSETKRIKDQLLRVTDGLIGGITDMVLMMMYFTFASPGRHTSYDFEMLAEESRHFVDTINYKAIKRSLYALTQKGHIQRSSKRTQLDVTITKKGRKRIIDLCPIYQEQRPWSGHMYLISYDIPINANLKRAALRSVLHRNGCALLQASLWLTPYDPHAIIHEFRATNHPGGTILISKLGTDGAIGDETVHELIQRIYRLDELAERYTAFIQRYSSTQIQSIPFIRIAIDYYSILKDDPQLPYALLPKKFPCKSAYRLFLSLINN